MDYRELRDGYQPQLSLVPHDDGSRGGVDSMTMFLNLDAQIVA